MTAEAIALMTKIETEGKRQAQEQGFRWDNRHPTYRDAVAAFEASDVAALKRVWADNFC